MFETGLRKTLAVLLALLVAAPLFYLLAGPSAPRYHVLLITVDTLRADHLGAYGYERETSPAIDALMRSASLFEDTVASSTWTFPTLASVLTGASPPSHHGYRFHDKLDDSFETLPEILSREGYRTASILTHVWLHPRYGLMQGIGEVDRSLLDEQVASRYGTVTSHKVTDRALSFVDEHLETYPGTPLFLWAHYFDPHFSYLSHVQHGIDFGPEKIDRYDGEIRFTDRHIGRLLDGLRERNLLDETLICFVADHGEKFGERSGKHPHGDDLYVETLKVPFALSVPGVEARRIQSPVGHIDITPTICDFLELPVPSTCEGHSLKDLMNGEKVQERALLSEVALFPQKAWKAVTTSSWKLVIGPAADLGAQEPVQLFDRRNDPRETRDRSAEHAAVVTELRAELEKLRARSSLRAPGSLYKTRATPTQQEEEALRAIGY